MNECDSLQGNINRMMVTDDIDRRVEKLLEVVEE